jgi:hypothetical protein
MGRGPREDDGNKTAWEKWYREEGTLRQLHILQEAEQKAKEEQATEVCIPSPPYGTDGLSTRVRAHRTVRTVRARVSV